MFHAAFCLVFLTRHFLAGPAGGRQRRVSPGIHAYDQEYHQDQRTSPLQDDISIQGHSPEGCDDQETLPRIPAGPRQQADDLVQWEYEWMGESQGPSDGRRCSNQERRLLMHENGGSLLCSRTGVGLGGGE